MKKKINLATKVAELLIQARFSEPLKEIPKYCRPRNIEEVYAVHDAIVSKLGPSIGWKVGAANTEAVPICAPILAGSIHKSPVFLDPKMYAMRGIESEIAFRFSSALPPKSGPYQESSVLNAIDVAFPAIEICETRFLDMNIVDNMSKLADNISNGALILGSAWNEWRTLQIEKQQVEMNFDDKVVISHQGGNNAGNITRLLVWIANHLSDRGIGITQGQVITTGSWTGLIQSGSAQKITTNFQGIGDVKIFFNNNF